MKDPTAAALSNAGEPSTASVPRWTIWAFLALLVLPFWPDWIDFEQVRRGQLLLLCGIALWFAGRLPRVRGEAAWLAFLAFLAVAALISSRSLQPWEALYRIAHFASVLVVLRLGAAAPNALATPMAVLLGITSLFGLLQRLGWVAISTYGTALEPVSTFGNTNVASEWTAVAAMAVAVLRSDKRALQLTALGLAGCYLVVNGSRSGQIALGIGLVVLLLKERNTRALLLSGITVGGAAIGLLATLSLSLPATEDQQAQMALDKRATHTIDVRLEIAKSSATLFSERPLFGFGPGQFQVQYPRVRSNEEIELSSHSRSFASEVRTAHDDWIELLVEGGLPVLLLFAAALFALQRGRPDKERLLPLFVLLLLMFARSPLANAPALCAAMLPVATALPRRAPEAWRIWSLRFVGLLLAILGLLPIVAHCLFAPYVAAVANGERPDAMAAARAHSWMWWEPRWLQVLAQEHLALGNAVAAKKAAAMAAELRPHDPELLKLVGMTLSNAGDFAEAAAIARHGLQYDPQNPELRVLLSTCLMLQGQYDEAIAAVVTDPHPVLRAQLRSHFAALAREASDRGDSIGAARCRMERGFFDILDSLGNPDKNIETGEHLKQFLVDTREAGRMSTELRTYLLSALQLLALGDAGPAVQAGERARDRNMVLENWQREMLGDKLKPLLEHEVWFEVLRRRPRGG